ncbi:MAG: MmcQ/YjbR family DNA-binding protein [Roseivirga sp.]
MTLEDIRNICLALPATSEEIKWENDLCFLLGKKMFITASLNTSPVTISFKTSEEDFVTFAERSGFEPAPYLARYGWIMVTDMELVSPPEWKVLIQKSYDLVLSRLPDKARKALGL